MAIVIYGALAWILWKVGRLVWFRLRELTGDLIGSPKFYLLATLLVGGMLTYYYLAATSGA